MDDDTRKIMMMIEAFDAEHERLQRAVQGFNGSVQQVSQGVRQAAKEAVAEALNGLQAEIQQAKYVLEDLQRFSFWRAAGQHAVMAVVAIVVTLLAVWWYVPSVSEMMALRAEREQLQGTIDQLAAKGGRLQVNYCGDQKRLCVLVSKRPTTWGSLQHQDQVYVIPVGY